ncbi:membrane protein insertase YidC [Anaerobacillus alkaliphilus]|uniref:Membrane protein insertase YidC n=1 Tax=Anaerobacillus alkaliphilus TaxID=1548597 RepID=A0A4Q0VQ98_9BACI|nr:membrane protein insertase YidC [Anaerobacillus alkaliphilus]RXI98359.1 membrane protein insertase YidC [Anaerobacillus alkaliphilus]
MGINHQILTFKVKNFILLLVSILSFLALTGCGMEKVPITAETPGVFNHFLVYPFSWLLLKAAILFGNSYGLSIIGVTVLIRVALLPLMVKQSKNMKLMRELQPKLNLLKEKYAKKDEVTQKKLQEEMMMLFKSEGVNPIGSGCLPVLIQMPIMIAFYYAIMRTEELARHSFLWFDLGAADPFYLLPILAALMTYLQLKVSASLQPVANNQLAILNNIMPVMILVFALNLPSALSLYWVIGGVFGIVQTYFLNIDRSQVKEIVKGQ